MTAQEISKVLNRKASLAIEKLKVNVHIIDVKTGFGRVDYKVKPIEGDGEQWVDSKRVTLINK